MAQVSRATFAASVASLLADNSSGAISEADMRSLLTDLEDSATWFDEGLVESVVGETGVVTKTELLTALNVEDGSTADQTGAQIKTAYEAEANAFTDTKNTKLTNIETAADVTDTANVTSSGALMDSELTSIADVKAMDQGVAVADAPQFASVEVGHATDTTITRVSAGVIAVEGNTLSQATGVEDNADVTDATNVAAAGAVMEDGSGDMTGDLIFSEKADHTATPTAGKGQMWVKNTVPNSIIFTDDTGTDTTLGAAGAGIANVVEDLTPQLGGDLDPNSQSVSGDWLPATDSTHDVGSASFAWAEGHFDSLFQGGNAVTALAAPGADRIPIYDQSSTAVVYATPANGVEISTTNVQATTNLRTDSIQLVIDGGGTAITTGVKGYIEVPYGCTIQQVSMLADQTGSIVVDIWKDTYANYPPTNADTITASAVPTISSGTKDQDATLTGWTTSITAGDILGFNVDSATTVERVTIALEVLKT